MTELKTLMEERRYLEASIAEKESWAQSYETSNFAVIASVDSFGNATEKTLTDDEIVEDRERARLLRLEAESLKLRQRQIVERLAEINNLLDAA